MLRESGCLTGDYSRDLNFKFDKNFDSLFLCIFIFFFSSDKQTKKSLSRDQFMFSDDVNGRQLHVNLSKHCEKKFH
jgi:hypothetical protein